ncbi:hypothetical protein ACWPMX_13535 [Tsuneonella sp. HG094]|jgi:hypothetical protein
MSLVAIFILGVANFALHRAVLESRHPLLGRSPWYVHQLGGRVTFATEFLLLFAALLLAAQGLTWVVRVYAGYGVLNALAAWLILTRRI